MLLCLDVGNTNILGGLFYHNQIKFRFRHATSLDSTSDQLGLFLRQVLRENNVNINDIKAIGLSSVVPSFDYSLQAACVKYFNKEPFWLNFNTIQQLSNVPIKICTRNPERIGADLLATAIAAIHYFPNRALIIVDLGTATTFTMINQLGECLGYIIQAGIKTSMLALQRDTAQLPLVKIITPLPDQKIGTDTVSAIQVGLYYSQLGAIREIINKITQSNLFTSLSTLSTEKNDIIILGTGGFASLFDQEKLFHSVMPDLVLEGIRIALLNYLAQNRK